jgi:hypothetical protein
MRKKPKESDESQIAIDRLVATTRSRVPLGSHASKRPLERDCNGNMLFKSDRASVEKHSCSTVGSAARRCRPRTWHVTGIRRSRWNNKPTASLTRRRLRREARLGPPSRESQTTRAQVYCVRPVGSLAVRRCKPVVGFFIPKAQYQRRQAPACQYAHRRA